MHFADDQTAKAVLQVSKQLLQQQLGRQVQNFDSEAWAAVSV